MFYFTGRIFFRIALLFFVQCFLISGCGGKSVRDFPSAADLMKTGNKLARDDDYFTAKDFYQRILEDYPDSSERIMALLRLADSHYKEGEYPEAKFNYQKFIELYPVHSKVDHAHFYKAMSYYNIIDLAVRDQTATHSALEGFEEILKRFPNSPYHSRALVKKKESLKSLAGNVLAIGRFYFDTGSYQAAINRLQGLLKEYPEQSFGGEVAFLIAESYFHEQNYDKARVSYHQLLDEFPEGSFSREALNRLKTLR